MTYHSKLVVKDGTIQSDGKIGPPNVRHPQGGWLCDQNNAHVDHNNP